MISRRGLFRLLSGALASPVLKPMAALFPDNGISEDRIPWWAGGWWRNRSLYRTLDLYYSKKLLEALRNNTSLFKMCQVSAMPANTGKTIQFFTYKLPEGEVETV